MERMAESNFTDPQPRSQSLLRGAVFLFLVLTLGTFLALGSWQVQRLAWKKDLMARIDGRVHAEPVSSPGLLQWNESADPRSQYEYLRVRLQGRFLHEREVQVYANSLLGPGYWVMTPLETSDDIVWINRGFVPNEKRRPDSRQEALPAESVEVIGLLRMAETQGLFVRNNVAAEDRWYHRDLAAMTDVRGLDRTAPYFVDADATPNPGGWPRGGLTVIQFRNNHLSYALTWFGLAVMNVIALIYFIRTEWRNPARALRDNADSRLDD